MSDQISGKSGPPASRERALSTWSSSVREFQHTHGTTGDLEILYEEMSVAEEELRTQQEEILAVNGVLEAERAGYQQLFEHAPVPYLVTDPNGTVATANHRACDLIGINAEHLRTRVLISFVPVDERAAFRVELLRIVKSHEPSCALRFNVVGRDERARAITAFVGVGRDPAGQVTELRWMLVDETTAMRQERDDLLAAAQVARQAAEAANVAKTQLLATVSHELRTPLAAIAGYAELLELGLRGPLSAEQLADVRRMRGAQEHMLHLLDDLLLYFRLGLGGLTANVTKTRVSDILSGLSSFVAPQANQRRIAVEIATADAELFVEGDVDRARQILINLLTNAVKFSPPASDVRVNIEVNGAEVQLRVCDSGPGIPSDQAAAVFEPFVQLNTPTTGRTGFGLGLAISRKLAELMGGRLVVDADAGHGSVFMLILRRA